ncbi:MAG: SGNH/GDSL hydrolase family protein [Lachnospiraceae bacterium]|nr:SGNH/GDSL hydrolase family protein [Lachnospiraceae bacterium]
MRIFKKISPLAYLAVLLLMNAFLSFVLEPARGSSELMWKQYYKEDDIDTIFIGSSLCLTSFDPYIFDERLGVKSFNMGTPLQAMPQTVRSLEVAIADHDIKTVIFGMGFSTLKYEAVEEAELTYEKARAREKGGIQGFVEGLKYIYSDGVRTDEKSVNYLFPWLYNRVDLSPSVIINNVKSKIELWQEELRGEQNKADRTFHKGYQNETQHVVDYEYKWDGVSDRFYSDDFNADMMAEFEKIIRICQDNEIDLIVVNTPHPSYDVISCYEYYDRNEDEFLAVCDAYGIDYYDFSLAKPEVYEPKAEYYADHEHMNQIGSQIFSERVCDLLLRRVQGENMDVHFYDAKEFIEMNQDMVEEWDNYYW